MKGANDNDPIKVGVSACLLGEKVRFDGGHKQDRYVSDVLAGHFQFVPVCPEVEAGMGVPREAVRLVGSADSPQMLGRRSGTDWTEQMTTFAAARLNRADLADLCGYILKKESPSCGPFRVKVYSVAGMPSRAGVGLYAQALADRFPLLPIEDEGRLNDPHLRDNFIVRVFAYHALRSLFRGSFQRSEMVAFHSRYKYLLMAHSPKHYSLLGKLVAAVSRREPEVFASEYSRLFMEALSMKATVRKNVNVLLHIMGYLKKHLTAQEKQDLLNVIEDYHRELVPLVVPITLLRHYVDKFAVAYIQDQAYLRPHPKELMLRNRV